MIRYALTRLVLLPPTLFLISIVLFGVLNLAPGDPGTASAQGVEPSTRGAQRESDRAFRAQFHLDRPILLNTCFLFDRDDTAEALAAAFKLRTGVAVKDAIQAAEELERCGDVLVSHLVALLDEPLLAWAATQTLVAAAPRLQPSHAMLPITDWTYARGATDSEAGPIHRRWREYYAAYRDRFEWTAIKTLKVLFLETRFAAYWSNLIRFDFGISTTDRRPVRDAILSRLRYSVSLTLLSLLLSLGLAIPLGIFSAANRSSRTSAALTTVMFLLYSTPVFFTGTVLLRILTEGDPLAIFPTGGFVSQDFARMTTAEQLVDVMWHLALPVMTYASVAVALFSRYSRAGVMEVIQSDYVRTARAKGLSEFAVVIKHAARTGMIPILTLLGTLLPVIVSGSVVIEVIFNIPGIGLYLFDAINLRDYNAVMGVLMTVSLLTLVGILISDLLYAAADPRISLG